LDNPLISAAADRNDCRDHCPPIGDVLGHRDLESTCVYLRLDIDALRDVALEVPASNSANGGGLPCVTSNA
jgi:hypothetical protein